MPEKETQGYAFVYGGRPLEEAPADLPLSDLLRDFSTKVLDELDRSGLVIITGEPRLGKTELLLGRTRPPIKAGGLPEVLTKKDVTYVVINCQGHGGTRIELEEIIAEDNLANKPEVVMIDEAGVMFYSEELKFDIVKRLLNDGRKVVLVKTRVPHPNQTDTDGEMVEKLNELGIKVSEQQQFDFPPYILSNSQSIELLMQIYPKLTKDKALEIVDKLNKYGIPKIFGVVSHCLPNPEYIDRNTFTLFWKHISLPEA